MEKSLRAPSGRLDRTGGRSLPRHPALLSARACFTLSSRLAGTAMAASGLLLVVLATLHRSPLWHGAFLGLLAAAEVTWAIAWLRRPSFATAWTGVGFGAYLIPIWALAATVRLPIETAASAPGLGVAATLFALAALLSLASVLVMSPPVMGRLNFIASAAVPAAALGAASFGFGLLIDLLARHHRQSLRQARAASSRSRHRRRPGTRRRAGGQRWLARLRADQRDQNLTRTMRWRIIVEVDSSGPGMAQAAERELERFKVRSKAIAIACS